MSVTVATEPLCGVPPGLAVWLGGGDAGINGPSVCNGEECGCRPGIWVSGPCPGEEHFTLCQLGLLVQWMAWGEPPFFLSSHPPHLRILVCAQSLWCRTLCMCTHVFEGEWLRRVLQSAPRSPPPLCRPTKRAPLTLVCRIFGLSRGVAMVNLCRNAT